MLSDKVGTKMCNCADNGPNMNHRHSWDTLSDEHVYATNDADVTFTMLRDEVGVMWCNCVDHRPKMSHKDSNGTLRDEHVYVINNADMTFTMLSDRVGTKLCNCADKQVDLLFVVDNPATVGYHPRNG
eukprot:12033321-Karenia_brevis.AAC.1